ncbi:MAG TPA: AbrB/MazE/SpoVT family DNA-binding domain-containing protein [Terriglobia bacterium]|nr:AbrB/MazE/SpoVT family DNA-binding domain-containing protein [Terriglobia bacterium]
MALVRIKTKYQVTLPTSIRKKARLEVGDLLEAKVRGNRITLTPQTAVDRELALALEDVEHGRTLGPFRSAKVAVRALRRTAKRLN